MATYKAPQRDIRFVAHEVCDFENHYKNLGAEDVDAATIDSFIEAGAQFSENELAPLNRSGDEEGCHFADGVVTTPKGFKEAYQKFCELGFPALSADVNYGGSGMPGSLSTVVNEMTGTANWSWAMYPGLSHGAMETLKHHGTEEQKQDYLTKLISGEWTGTMCLTESHAGSDLGIIKTKAVPNDDGSYAISGTKIFISAGEHDMAENIVHIVLARLPGAPGGTKGISLFVVPKFLVEDGGVGARNSVTCGSIEHKMGIKASATCVINFDSATGYLIGPENKGLNCMFTFMNVARIGTAVQGLAAAELAFQGSLEYARDRLAMRSMSGPKAPDKPADPIIVHPAVRNMLMTQKAFAEGGRALIYTLAQYADEVEVMKGDSKAHADEMLSFLTPIAKAFLTETGFEAAKHGVQVYGGHGFIREWGMEQNVRDTTIACLYEGTTEIQSLDLLGRKVLGSKGKLLKNFTDMIGAFARAHGEDPKMAEFIAPLAKATHTWGELTQLIGQRGMENPDEVGAAAVDYMYYSGYVTLAFFWARMAQIAQKALADGTSETEFYEAKLKTARFYFAKLMPRTATHAASIKAGGATLMEMGEEQFAF